MANIFTPDYLNIDYNTLISAIKSELADNATFRDFNYEGSNISVLIELVSYIGEQNVYFLNKIAKNVYMETVDMYENASRLAKQEGYEPKGYISSKTTLSLTVSSIGGANFIEGDTLYIPAWHQILSSKNYDDAAIKFATTSSQSAVATSGSTVEFEVPVVQGEVVNLNYTGKDLVDNELILPTYNYAHDDDLDEAPNTIELTVNDSTWSRISDFYDDYSSLTDVDTVYMMQYDKYERTKIVFNSSRTVPGGSDVISIYALKSLGPNGNVAAETINNPNAHFVKNTSNTTVGPAFDGWLSNSTLSISNSAASIGGSIPETIDDIKANSVAIHNAQYRNVTATDYKAYLETRSDVECAYAWGEQEIAPSGSILEYNKVHLSVVPPNNPDSWNTGTINTSSDTWTPSGGTTSSDIVVPVSYVDSYTTALEEFLEPRKMLNAYEIWELPELVYFTFTFGVRLYRLYSISDVRTDILNKLIYYFRPAARSFYDLINFMNIQEFILDTTIVSPTDDFDYIKGIRNLIIRDIDCSKHIYEINEDGDYPQFTTADYVSDVENKIRPVRLGFNQFPILSSDIISVAEEI